MAGLRNRMAIEKVWRKNRRAASAARRTMPGIVAAGDANRAGRLAALESACVCDQCGQERSSLRGWEQAAGFQAAQNRPQKNSCVRFRFLQEWDSQVAALAVSVFWKPASAGFLFIGSSVPSICYARGEAARIGPAM